MGKIVEQTWLNLPDYFENILLDKFVVMPNHFHGIIMFLDVPVRKSNGEKVGLSEIISSFKSYSQKKIRDWVGETSVFPVGWKKGGIEPAPTNFNYHKIWQKSFYDHVISISPSTTNIPRKYFNCHPFHHAPKVAWEIQAATMVSKGEFRA